MHDPSQHERDGTGQTGALSITWSRRRLLLAAIGIVILAGGLVWASMQVLDRPERIVVERSPLLDRPAPEFALQSLAGEMVRLSDYRGRPVIVNFWASWCVPCREEFPLLRDVRQRHSGDGLEVLGVVHEDGPDAARNFADGFDARWPLLLDPDNSAWRAYGGVFLPITFYVDRQGITRAVSYGPPPPDVLKEQIAKIR